MENQDQCLSLSLGVSECHLTLPNWKRLASWRRVEIMAGITRLSFLGVQLVELSVLLPISHGHHVACGCSSLAGGDLLLPVPFHLAPSDGCSW